MFDDMALYMPPGTGPVHRLKADWGAFYFHNLRGASSIAPEHWYTLQMLHTFSKTMKSQVKKELTALPKLKGEVCRGLVLKYFSSISIYKHLSKAIYMLSSGKSVSSVVLKCICWHNDQLYKFGAWLPVLNNWISEKAFSKPIWKQSFLAVSLFFWKISIIIINAL